MCLLIYKWVCCTENVGTRRMKCIRGADMYMWWEYTLKEMSLFMRLSVIKGVWGCSSIYDLLSVNKTRLDFVVA